VWHKTKYGRLTVRKGGHFLLRILWRGAVYLPFQSVVWFTAAYRFNGRKRELELAKHRQADAQVMKKYSQMKLQMKREALEKLNRLANEMTLGEPRHLPENRGCGTVSMKMRRNGFWNRGKCFRMKGTASVGV
jgi:hypothetical protein